MSMTTSVRPSVLLPRLEMIPPELKALPQWVAWRLELRKGKWTKPPINPHSGGPASSTDPRTWAPFDKAVAFQQSRMLDGIGFALSRSDPYVGVDLDDCITESGEISTSAKELIDKLASYTEVSPSGRGIRIIARGSLPPGRRKKGDFEVYDSGRYVTLTGHHVSGTPTTIEHREEELAEVHLTVFGSQSTQPTNGETDHHRSNGRRRTAKQQAAIDQIVAKLDTEVDDRSARDFNALCSLVEFGVDREEAWRLVSGRSKFGTDGEDYFGRTWAKASAKTHRREKPLQRVGQTMTSDSGVFPRTDSGNAELMAQLYGNRVRFDHKRGRWLLWSGHWWAEDADSEVKRLAKSAARERFLRAVDIQDPQQREQEARWAISSESRHRLDAMLSLAQAEKPIADPGTGWDADPWVLGVANGILDLQTGRLRDGRLEDRITAHTDIVFDPRAKCPRWVQFLEEVFLRDNQLITFIWRALGYTLSGDTSEQCLFLGYGTGANGKTTFLSVLRHVFGHYAYNMPFSTLELTQRSSIPNDLAALAGRRLVTASETNEATRLNEARIKALTGQDSITARFLQREFFTFRPVAKYWLAVNHKPRVADDSYGFWRRVRLIPFLAKFDDSAADKTLEDTLRQEAAGILAWIVKGFLAWQKAGLSLPKAVRSATDEYRRECDPLAEFIEVHCVVAPSRQGKASELYRAYHCWALAEGMRERDILTPTSFGLRMADRFAKKHGRKGTNYIGVGLKR